MNKLPSHDELLSLTNECIEVLNGEMLCHYRAGSLLDFTAEEALPLIVVPDLHARGYFLNDVLNYTLPESFCAAGEHGNRMTVRDRLDAHAIRVVCVGDALHSEMRGRERWIRAYMERLQGIRSGEAMTEEMAEGLMLLMQVMRLKVKYSKLFHFLKGNHENIRNRRGGGDYPFCKFTDEGAMTNDFMREVYGDDAVYVIGCFEDALPLAAMANNCVISHAEPRRAFTREEIINAREEESTVEALTWTANGEAQERAAAEVISQLGIEDGVYITGHRPVKGQYNLRAAGLVVQIHNPDKEQIALVRTDRKFDPERDIVSVDCRV